MVRCLYLVLEACNRLQHRLNVIISAHRPEHPHLGYASIDSISSTPNKRYIIEIFDPLAPILEDDDLVRMVVAVPNPLTVGDLLVNEVDNVSQALTHIWRAGAGMVACNSHGITHGVHHNS